MTDPLATFDLWAGLLGGLALFLFGMEILTQGLKSAAGDTLKGLLGRLTRNRLIGVGTGAAVTALIQSSSATTVILVGFISAGLMTLPQSIAVIMGANIGTTMTTQILAFHVDRVALPIVTVGFAVAFLARRSEWRQLGQAVLGLGLVFYGMSVMSGAVFPLRSYTPFTDFMTTLHNPLLAAVVGAAFTALVQASAATTGILIVLASQGLVALEPAIAIALGANIGTCITAGLAAIGKPREAVRAAVAHTLFNVAGVAIWIWFVPQLAELARWLSPVHADLGAADRIAADMPRQIANVHTFFNVANTLLFIGFTTQIARLVRWLIPDRPLRPDQAMLPRYLDRSLLATPAIALQAARLETGRLGQEVCRMVEAVMPAAISGSRNDLERVAAMDKVVDALHLAVVEFLGKISSGRLTEPRSNELMQLVEVANDLEQIGDRIATALVTSARKRIDEEVRVSEQTAAILGEYHAYLVTALRDAVQAVAEGNAELAREVGHRKKGFRERTHQLMVHGIQRLTASEPNRLQTYAREMDVMEILDGTFNIVRRIARSQAKLVAQETVTP